MAETRNDTAKKRVVVGKNVSETRRSGLARRHSRLRKKVAGTSVRPRLVVTRSSRHITVQVVDDLVGRSNRLGADPRHTNYAGGNTSAKGSETDPVTARPVELVWVKGSGGDLGTLTPAGLAALRLDRLRSLVDVYPGVEREDEMVAAFDFCLYGKGGAAPSIDTAMHGLVEAAHVDHLHPDAGIALAAAADGRFHAAWIGDSTGKRQVWTAAVDVGAGR